MSTIYSRYTRRNRFREDYDHRDDYRDSYNRRNDYRDDHNHRDDYRDDRRDDYEAEPVAKHNSLLKNNSTRLRFSVYVIIANFIAGIIGMILGTDLTALGVFLSLSNTPLYAYVIGRSFRPASIPREYYRGHHSGSGGLGTIINNRNDNYNNGGYYGNQGYDQSNYGYGYADYDDYNIPYNMAENTNSPGPINYTSRDEEEIG